MSAVNIYALAFVFAKRYPRERIRIFFERLAITYAIGFTQIEDAAAKAAVSMNAFTRAMLEAEQREFIRIEASLEADPED